MHRNKKLLMDTHAFQNTSHISLKHFYQILKMFYETVVARAIKKKICQQANKAGYCWSEAESLRKKLRTESTLTGNPTGWTIRPVPSHKTLDVLLSSSSDRFRLSCCSKQHNKNSFIPTAIQYLPLIKHYYPRKVQHTLLTL